LFGALILEMELGILLNVIGVVLKINAPIGLEIMFVNKNDYLKQT
jgi:hypothetical protein